MQSPIAQTKIIIPRRRPDLLSRPRLIDLLYNLIDYRLILAVAPAGYGKTSLFIDFAHQTELPVCWYAVDATDKDLQKFVTYFASAIVHRFPDLKDSILGTPEALFLDRLPIDQLVIVIVNELYDRIHEHFLVVVDDYHFVDGHPEIDAFVSQFVQLVGEHCHVALLSRTLISLSELPLMIARSYVGGLSFEELRFQEAEIRELLRTAYQITLPEATLKTLLESTEGWITGLLLSSLRNNEGGSSWARLARASGVNLYSYLAQQILDQQPPVIRQFLLHTSLLEEFNAALCMEVLEAPPVEQGWQQIIDTIFHNNLFVLNVGEEGTWVRYHHLFQEFLQQTLLREAPDEAESIRRRLAAYYIKHRTWEKAHALYHQLGDTDALVDLIKRAGPELVKRGRYTILTAWLETLPADVVNQDSGIMSLRGIVEVESGDVKSGLNHLNQAATMQQTTDQWFALAQTLVRRSIAHQFLGNYSLALHDAEQAGALVTRCSQDNHFTTDIHWLEAESLRMKGLCYYLKGSFSNAVCHLDLARQKYQAMDELLSYARVTAEVAGAHMATGHYREALTNFEAVLDSWRRLHNIIGQANVLNNLGVLYHLQGDYEQALDRLIEALNCAKRSGYMRVEAYTLASIGDLFADLKMTAIANEFYEQAYSIARIINERFLLLHLNLALLLLSLPQDRQNDAKMFLDAAGRLVSAETSPFEHGLFRMAVGQYHLMGGRKTEAIAPLEEAVDSLAKTDQCVEAARAHLFLAAACHDAGDRPHAVEAVAQTFKIASKLEHWHPLVIAGHKVSHFLETLQVDGDCKSNVERLLQKVKEFNRVTPDLRRRLRQKVTLLLSSTSTQRPRLHIRALGRGEVTLNGTPVESSNWQTQVARELFFYFVAHDEGLTKEEIGEIFWPDSTPDQLKTRFKNAIYRLRSPLFQDVIVFDNDLYRFNRLLDYEYDVESFEHAITIARTTSDETQKQIALERIAELYQGDFLPDMDAVWVQLERERLWRLYVEAMLELAQIQLAAGLAGAALTHCQALLAADPCLESAHRMAMRIHAHQGNRGDVARQYEQCRTALLDEFGVPPSPETEALYDELMR